MVISLGTNLALNLSTSLLSLIFILYTHFEPIVFFILGISTISCVLFSSEASIYNFIASIYLLVFEVSLKVCGSVSAEILAMKPLYFAESLRKTGNQIVGQSNSMCLFHSPATTKSLSYFS